MLLLILDTNSTLKIILSGLIADVDAQALSPEPIVYEETAEAEEEGAEEAAGSYSPELLHGEETEEAIDPEEDRAILVLSLRFLIRAHTSIKKYTLTLRPVIGSNWIIG